MSTGRSHDKKARLVTVIIENMNVEKGKTNSHFEDAEPTDLNPVKTIEDIAPSRKRQKTGRKPAKTQILTDTTNMAEIKSEHQKRQEQKNTAAKKNAKKNLTTDEISIGTINIKEIVKQKKEKAVEDESDSDNLAFYSSSSSEITDIEEQIEKEREEEDFVIGMINVNDYVLVRFLTKNTERHNVGKILEKVEGGEYLINFMQRKKPGYHFVFSDVEDQSMVFEDDIRKLSPPSFVGGAARSKERLVFPINFDKHNNVN
ncbi:hypothetical protein RN001_007401 [Aquatica leii]|uniref:Uncharacterized protein n=1 Tax=Aquatica leii TaxID=1421715 RepID=A0AAN7SQW9_9COLE|nr:hypothetical protein RN001_007401 [Aquatica leii]